MKICESWLRSLINTDISTEQLASQLTMAGLEVDAISPVAGNFEGVYVAEVVETKPHPEADKLTICLVEAGDNEPHSIICGASNVRAGLKVALAKLGATLPGGFKIKKAKLRGQPSLGMLCSSSELGLEEKSDGIMELPSNAPVGQDLRTYMQLDDNMLDVDLTPNRADCFSHLGIAREIAAIAGLTLNEFLPNPIQEQTRETKIVEIIEPEVCLQYYGRVFTNINTEATTPLWLAERLRRSGIRPIHPVVDVTNYVMMAIGQPMHAFDTTKIDGKISVRFARDQESLKLLDGQLIKLNSQNLVIADEHKVLALAGVMGGDASSVDITTQHVFLESALFAPHHISGVARQHGLFTDSSQRFERGVDPALAKIALEYASSLLLEIVGGEPGPITPLKHDQNLTEKKIVQFDPAKVLKLTGVDVSHDRMVDILTGLGFDVSCENVPWHVVVPTHRYDVSLDVDLVEEIIRLYGYQNIKSKPMQFEALAGKVNAIESMTNRVSDFLVARGYHESISYSFVDPELQKEIYPGRAVLELLNPISSELSQMRVGMWPGLIASMFHNVHRQHQSLRLFEAGVVFHRSTHEIEERHSVAGLMVGKKDSFNWASTDRSLDFYDLKGDLEALFKLLQLKGIYFDKSHHDALHPGKSASIYLNNKLIGDVGVIHPKIMSEMGLSNEVMVFELNISQLMNHQAVRYQPISKYPYIRRDLSLLVDENVTAFQIQAAVKEALKDKLLKTFDVFDVYQGEHIPQGKKSIAVTFTLQDAQKTLTDEEINAAIDAILELLQTKHAITLRD